MFFEQSPLTPTAQRTGLLFILCCVIISPAQSQCSDLSITSSQGTITGGSNENDRLCYFWIMPAGAKTITFTVHVVDPSMTFYTCARPDVIYGDCIRPVPPPPSPLRAETFNTWFTGIVLVIFQSEATFSASWTSTTSCPTGYSGNVCTDDDECSSSLDNNCDTDAVCTNSEGSFSCECNSGWTSSFWGAPGVTCIDVVECGVSDDCDANAVCTDSEGSFICACNSGWTSSDAGVTCSLNKCGVSDDCDANAVCTDSGGSFICECNSGWTSSDAGVTCSNVVECGWSYFYSTTGTGTGGSYFYSTTGTGTGGSYLYSTGTGTGGSYLYSTTGTGTGGSYFYSTTGTGTGGSYFYSTTGTGTGGSYFYSTDTGTGGSYLYSTTGTGTGGSYFYSTTGTGTGGSYCDANAVCTDSEGSFICECNSGWTSSDAGVTCSDVIECGVSDDCDANAVCTDSEGSFICACNSGWTSSDAGVTCSNVVECGVSDDCDANAVCTDSEGSFICGCSEGFVGNGVSCSDIENECSPKCDDAHAVCTDSGDSFACICSSGWTSIQNDAGVKCSNAEFIARCNAYGGPAWKDLRFPKSGTSPHSRDSLAMVVSNSKLYLFGGNTAIFMCCDDQGSVWGWMNDLHEYDIVWGKWTDLSSPRSGTPPSYRHAMGIAASNSKLYIFGGYTGGRIGHPSTGPGGMNDLHEYDITTRSWRDLSSPGSGTPPSARNNMGMVASNSKLYVFGGYGYPGRVFTGLYEYVIATGSWKDLSSPSSGTLPSGRCCMGMAESNSKLYIFGGRDQNDLHEYDIATGSWRDLSSPSNGTPPSGRSFMGMVASNSKLYIFGGRSDGGRMDDLHQYEIISGNWTELSPPRNGKPGKRSSMGMAVSNSKLYIFGGYGGSRLGDLYEYDIFCTILDECSVGADDCSSKASCTDTEESFTCACNTGFADWGAGTSCEEDQCTQGTHNCDMNAECTDTDGSFTCACNAGYVDWSAGTMCDRNQCFDRTHNCATEAACADTAGTFTCSCNTGFVDWGGGTSCDENQCINGTHDCALEAACLDTEGSFTCACNTGFADWGDGQIGTSCKNPCTHGAHNCAANAACTNWEGSFNCECTPGYSGDGLTCSDDNECENGTSNCDGNAICTNEPGSFYCECSPGFVTIDQAVTCVPEALVEFTGILQMSLAEFDSATQASYKTTVASVADISPFDVSIRTPTEQPADGRRLLVTTISVPTTIVVGTDRVESIKEVLVTDLEGALVDEGIALSSMLILIDECLDGSHSCDESAACSDTVESFTCACKPGYTGEGNSCTNIDECAMATDNCDASAMCTDSQGSFTCSCTSAWTSTDEGVTCIASTSGGVTQARVMTPAILGAAGAGALGLGFAVAVSWILLRRRNANAQAPPNLTGPLRSAARLESYAAPAELPVDVPSVLIEDARPSGMILASGEASEVEDRWVVQEEKRVEEGRKMKKEEARAKVNEEAKVKAQDKSEDKDTIAAEPFSSVAHDQQAAAGGTMLRVEGLIHSPLGDSSQPEDALQGLGKDQARPTPLEPPQILFEGPAQRVRRMMTKEEDEDEEGR